MYKNIGETEQCSIFNSTYFTQVLLYFEHHQMVKLTSP